MLKSGPAVDMPEWNNKLNDLNQQSTQQQITQTLEQALAFLAGDSKVSALVDSYVSSIEEAATGIDDESFKLRFQSYASRNNSPAKVFSSLYTSFASANRNQKIVGVNFVGPENGFVAMRDYALHMKMFALLKQHFPNVKLALHAGELSLGMVTPEGLRSHIRDAVMIAGANRIGHGVDIASETEAIELLKLMKQKTLRSKSI